jgi:hypothetical protein
VWALALAWVIAGAAIVVSARRLSTLSRIARLSRQRRELVRRRAPVQGDDVFAALLLSLEQSHSDGARVAIVNEQLSDVARSVDVGARIPESAARVALTSGVALALLELVPVVASGRGLASPLVAGSAGFIGYVVCADIGRRARRHGQQIRACWNELGRLLLSGGLADREKVPLS